MKKNIAYTLLVLVITLLAFSLDIWSSSTPFEVINKNILNSSGIVATSQEISYPIHVQIINLAKNFLYGLAAAIFITVFVANRLESTQRAEKEAELKKLNDAVSLNVFDSLFKTIIPEEIFKVIKQDIIENKVIRREAKWIYNFEKCENGIRCIQTVRYELHNLSQAAVSDPVRLDLDSLGGNAYKLLLAECTSRDGEHLVHYDPSKVAEKNISINNDGRKTSVQYTVTIPPNSYVVYKTIYERTYPGEITDFQGTKLPVIGLDIIATYPEGYEFDFAPVISSTSKLTVESATQKIYRVDGGILPQQGIVYFLTKKVIAPKQNDLPLTTQLETQESV
ncbi:hypothetical protein NPS49_09250 [Pseudomonas putida]|uniref:hypothetical protein n=1 Tax=Pseudomonas putida TaxID=303 RepID=UPI0023641CA2|nr:hypothetical protein [Pseudomonas putida]MDD2068507.1 hypothetical protein [Pseudomonas putida]HDS1739684.1 hypothetical protein [Pseudomonas putida]